LGSRLFFSLTLNPHFYSLGLLDARGNTRCGRNLFEPNIRRVQGEPERCKADAALLVATIVALTLRESGLNARADCIRVSPSDIRLDTVAKPCLVAAVTCSQF
jgi:hypothetical protein